MFINTPYIHLWQEDVVDLSVNECILLSSNKLVHVHVLLISYNLNDSKCLMYFG